ncbi:MAG: hypothetical protein RIR00_697 [Pseudomonadota bacterium]|jgi:uncharacterized hydrophobic protein (TIGR00271 family)
MTTLLYGLFNLRHDQAPAKQIDDTLRQGLSLAGTNMWVLILAIVIASIGLNVNSTAVIIGAMLISPLMGPIMGIGYGAGINDFPLIRLAARNLLIFLFISLSSSTLYFLISPLTQAHSELLARTTPTLWDVLIAFSGGAAGIIAATRKDKTLVLPGVAIATALMPPLCTAGYGLATANFKFFIGAFYLFFINSVFIALAALILVKLMKLPQHRYLDDGERKRARLWISLIVLITLIPSAFLAVRLVQDEYFGQRAQQLLARVQDNKALILLSHEINREGRKVSLIIAGDSLTNAALADINHAAATLGLDSPQLDIRVAGKTEYDTEKLRKQLHAEILRDALQVMNQDHAAARTKTEENLKNKMAEPGEIFYEARAIFPAIETLTLGKALSTRIGRQADNQESSVVIILEVISRKPLSAEEQTRFRRWVSARLQNKETRILFSTSGRK